MNEFELIAAPDKIAATNPNVVMGAGDDCAVLDFGLPGQMAAVQNGCNVEGVHLPKTRRREKSATKPWPAPSVNRRDGRHTERPRRDHRAGRPVRREIHRNHLRRHECNWPKNTALAIVGREDDDEYPERIIFP